MSIRITIMVKTTHPTTIPIIDDALVLSLLRAEGDGADVAGDMGYSQLQAIEEEPESLELYQAPLYAYI